ncbi:spermatogenesis-defective protein 39 homolog isoform X2 [Liolophura sinensis]|uniref:spermatogenesis-defective protein 39 homolog isoform X2 n=1 Tax=Liolophura sinensis TaxID=3198878 RepID=UPI00315898B0
MAASMTAMDDIDDDEAEWLSSGSSKKSHSKFNFFDDSVTDDARDLVRRWKVQKDDDDDDEEETDSINWDGTPASTIGYKASRPGGSPAVSHSPVTKSSTLPLSPGAGPPPVTRHVKTSAGPTHNRSQSLTIGKSLKFSSDRHVASSSTLKGQFSMSDPSIEEVISSNVPAKSVSKLEMELSDLKRALQIAKREKWRQPSAYETVRAIIQGEPYGLEMCKTKEQKLALLDEAIKMHDGNAITAAVLFLQNTLKGSVFNLELSRRPTAVNHYLSYLRAHYEMDKLEETLGMLGRTEEAAMMRYKLATTIKDPRAKIKHLQRCLSAHFRDPSLVTEAGLLEEQISILERQGPIEDSDARAEQEGKVLAFRENPRRASIINMPVITTLYYCCFYHYDLPENNLASPMAIKKTHQLTEKQFLWTALGARSRLKRWKDVETLLTAKSWFGGTKMKSVIGFDKVVAVLHKTGAPSDILSKYLKLVDDVERRLTLAKKYGCHDAVVDTYIALRDRFELEAYMRKLPPRSKEYYYAEDALRNSAHKWKT